MGYLSDETWDYVPSHQSQFGMYCTRRLKRNQLCGHRKRKPMIINSVETLRVSYICHLPVFSRQTSYKTISSNCKSFLLVTPLVGNWATVQVVTGFLPQQDQPLVASLRLQMVRFSIVLEWELETVRPTYLAATATAGNRIPGAIQIAS